MWKPMEEYGGLYSVRVRISLLLTPYHGILRNDIQRSLTNIGSRYTFPSLTQGGGMSIVVVVNNAKPDDCGLGLTRLDISLHQTSKDFCRSRERSSEFLKVFE